MMSFNIPREEQEQQDTIWNSLDLDHNGKLARSDVQRVLETSPLIHHLNDFSQTELIEDAEEFEEEAEN